MKPTKCPAREKKMSKKSEKKRGGEKGKVKVKTAVFASGSEGREVYDR